MPLQYKKSDLISAEPVFVNGSKTCVECDKKISQGKGKPVAVKFYSKKTVYVHTDCKETFLSKLRTY